LNDKFFDRVKDKKQKTTESDIFETKKEVVLELKKKFYKYKLLFVVAKNRNIN
jgi:hypothetical protein